VKESAYKRLKTMEEKVERQMELARRISAVEEHDVAERIITIHFLPDIIGNLRAFSRQEFRCVECNEKYRRLPLSGRCRRCGGNLTLTVHSSSIVKYLELSKKLCEEYNVSEYTRQRLRLIEYEIRSLIQENKQVTLIDILG
jgi:DNA polymerase II large subunit